MALRSDRLDAIVNLSKRRGFVYPSSEIYGGLRAAWDYGPLGVELKNNVKRQWWRYMVQERDDIVGLDSSVILAREVWEASGHVATFTDPLTECLNCHQRFRADHLLEAYEEKHGHARDGGPGRRQLPQLRRQGPVHRAQAVQRHAPHLHRPGRGRERPRVPAPGDRPGHLHQLQERAHHQPEEGAVRHRPESASRSATRSRRATSSSAPASSSRWRWSSSSSRARDEEWHQYWIDHRLAWWTGLGVNPENLRLVRAPEGEALPLLQADRRHRVPLRLRRLRVGRARGHREPHRLRPEQPPEGLRASTSPTSTRSPASGTPRT